MIKFQRIAIGLTAAAAVLGLFLVEFETGTALGTKALLVLLAAAALHEFYAMLARAGIESHARFGVVAAAVLLALRGAAPALSLSDREGRELFLAGLAFAAVAPLAFPLLRPAPEEPPGPSALQRPMATAFGLVYVTLLSSFLLELRLIDYPGERGLQLVVLLVAAVKTADSCAYFVGRMIGRKPLCWVSPKKTWEGSAASVLGSVAVCLVVGTLWWEFDWRLMLGFGLVADLAGQGGDLIESYLKRAVGVKDSGHTFGEIGGVLDLMDALLLAAAPTFIWADLLVARVT